MDWNKPPHRGSGPGSLQDLEEFVKGLKRRFNVPPFFGQRWLLILGLIALIIVVGGNCFYTVKPQETAVVQRFGKFVRTAGAGLHFKLPFGIETVRKVVTGQVMQQEYGYRTVKPGIRSRFVEKGYEEEARMLSGDLNVVDLQWTIQYKISRPDDFLFQVQDVEAALDDISASIVRRIVGNRYADSVLTVGRAAIAEKAREEIQQIIDEYRTGLEIVTVKLQNANPPEPVKAAFNEVNEARQEKERMINEAERSYNEKIPKAKGEARQVITQAEGYASERVNRAKGEATRFLDILDEYDKAPDVTRRRMYLEAVKVFIRRVDRFVILDEKQMNLLPLFDLNRPSSMGEAKPAPETGSKPPRILGPATTEK